MYRKLLNFAAATLMLPGLAFADTAAQWPEPGKPVHIVVPAPGGAGTADTIARFIADKLSKKIGGNFIIESRGGANGNIGATIAAEAKPDGNTLLFSWAGTLAVNPSLYKELSFDPQQSFDPVGLIAEVPNILVVNNSLPVKTMKDFISYVKAHPDAVAFGSTGNGSSMHIAGELFMGQTQTKMLHVPYSAPGQAVTNTIANDIQAMFQLVPGIVGQVKSGKVRALAVLSERRSPALPDVATTPEQGYPALLSSTWFALLAPQGTPRSVTQRVNVALNEILKEPDVISSLAAMGAVPLGGSSDQLASYLQQERVKWGRVVKTASITIQ